MFEILHYVDTSGTDHFQAWLNALTDRQAKLAVIRRIARLQIGLFGDRKSVRGGIQELRIDISGGYRVYFAVVGRAVILLTCGGNKQSQERYIRTAIDFAA